MNKIPEAVVEAVARAICVACEDNPDHQGDTRGNEFRWQDYRDVALAAISALTAACVNACAGIMDPTRFMQRAQRDEALLRQALDRLEAVVEHFDPYMGDNECRPMENARSTIAALRERPVVCRVNLSSIELQLCD